MALRWQGLVAHSFKSAQLIDGESTDEHGRYTFAARVSETRMLRVYQRHSMELGIGFVRCEAQYRGSSADSLCLDLAGRDVGAWEPVARRHVLGMVDFVDGGSASRKKRALRSTWWQALVGDMERPGRGELMRREVTSRATTELGWCEGWMMRNARAASVIRQAYGEEYLLERLRHYEPELTEEDRAKVERLRTWRESGFAGLSSGDCDVPF